MEPVLDYHHSAVDSQDYYLRRVIVGAAADGRFLSRLGEEQVCSCGVPRPSRTHLTFHCPAITGELEVPSFTEQRMLLRLVPFIPASPDEYQPDPQLLDFFIAERTKGCDTITLAVDGSCQEPSFKGYGPRAGWGVAHVFSEFSLGRPLYGPDQSAAYAERFALWQCAAAGFAAGVKVRLLQDNSAVVLRLQRALSSGDTSGTCQSFWKSLLAFWNPESVHCWMPGHGRQQEWQPPASLQLTAAQCRHANAMADAAASLAAATHSAGLQRLRRLRTEARAWSQQAAQLQCRATRSYWDRALDKMFANRDDFLNGD